MAVPRVAVITRPCVVCGKSIMAAYSHLQCVVLRLA